MPVYNDLLAAELAGRGPYKVLRFDEGEEWGDTVKVVRISGPGLPSNGLPFLVTCRYRKVQFAAGSHMTGPSTPQITRKLPGIPVRSGDPLN